MTVADEGGGLTDPGDPGDHLDLAFLDGVPRAVLDDDGLDVLELALMGALAASPTLVGVPHRPELVLTDAENTPLVHLVRDGASPTLRALRPFARSAGPQWDPTLRRPAPAVRADLRDRVRDGHVLALVVDEPPTDADLRAMVARSGSSEVAGVLCVMPVGRRRHPAGHVGWAGLARAGSAGAASLAAARPGMVVLPLAIPWPSGPPLPVDDVLAAFGASETILVRDLRSPEEVGRLAALPRAFEREVDALYPPASAAEVLRAAGGTDRRGAVVFLTGLSGSGKSTIARALAADLEDRDARRVTLLDGDAVRQSLSADLGFDAASREANIERIAYVASLISAHGGIAIAAPIAPFASGRQRARDLARAHGDFVLVHVSTPLEVCEARDRKGLYARARAGLVADFTGISSPYEPPEDADVVVDTTDTAVVDAVRLVREALERRSGDVEAPGDRPSARRA
jgi:sulfate adenylyltransferase